MVHTLNCLQPVPVLTTLHNINLLTSEYTLGRNLIPTSFSLGPAVPVSVDTFVILKVVDGSVLTAMPLTVGDSTFVGVWDTVWRIAS